MTMRLALILSFLFTLAVGTTHAQLPDTTYIIPGLEPTVQTSEAPDGIAGKKAPPLALTNWINLPEGQTRLDIPDFKGKYLVMLFFQHWCQASQKEAFPTLQTLIKQFEGEKDVAFLAVQTTFEGYTTNSEDKIQVAAKEFGLKIPIGHSPKLPGVYSVSLGYNTAGTPWWVIVTPDGIVEYNGHYLNPEEAEKNLRSLLAGKPVE